MTKEPPQVLSGTVTFVFTDIEGSTCLVARLGDDYAAVLAAHHRLLRQSFDARGGREVDNQGDAFFFAFPRARDAVAAAAEAQQALDGEDWLAGSEVRVRMGIHTGEPGLADTGHHGLDVVRAARISAAAHGGQVLVSGTTRDLVGGTLPEVSFRDHGEHDLKDIEQPERLFQLVAPGLLGAFPPPRTSGGPALAVGGREEELAAAAQAAVEGRPRAVTRRRALIAIAAALAVAIGALAVLAATRKDERRR